MFTWTANERLFSFADLGLIEDISDLWESEGLNDTMAGTRIAVTRDSKQYALPVSGVAWGMYHRKDVLADAGLEYPETFEDLLAACRTLRENDVVPITVGTQQLWPAAAFFDMLNMRINGIEFHLDLLAGEESFDDDRVKEVMGA